MSIEDGAVQQESFQIQANDIVVERGYLHEIQGIEEQLRQAQAAAKPPIQKKKKEKKLLHQSFKEKATGVSQENLEGPLSMLKKSLRLPQINIQPSLPDSKAPNTKRSKAQPSYLHQPRSPKNQMLLNILSHLNSPLSKQILQSIKFSVDEVFEHHQPHTQQQAPVSKSPPQKQAPQ